MLAVQPRGSPETHAEHSARPSLQRPPGVPSVARLGGMTGPATSARGARRKRFTTTSTFYAKVAAVNSTSRRKGGRASPPPDHQGPVRLPEAAAAEPFSVMARWRERAPSVGEACMEKPRARPPQTWRRRRHLRS